MSYLMSLTQSDAASSETLLKKLEVASVFYLPEPQPGPQHAAANIYGRVYSLHEMDVNGSTVRPIEPKGWLKQKNPPYGACQASSSARILAHV